MIISRVEPDLVFLPDAGCFSKNIPDAGYPAGFLPDFWPKKHLLRKAIGLNPLVDINDFYILGICT